MAMFLRSKVIKGEVELIVPSLLYFEVLKALKYSDLFEQDELNMAAESLENYEFNVLPINKEARERMIEIAIKHDITIYNASNLGLSLTLKKALITADYKMIRKLPNTVKKLVKPHNQIEDLLSNL